MNALALREVKASKHFPWFEDYSKHNTYCKVYNDGSCYIAVPTTGSVRKHRERLIKDDPFADLFNQFYLQAVKDNLSGEALRGFIVNGICEAFPDKWGIRDYVDKKLEKVQHNLAARKKRFRRKAFLNRWNYFVTFTYDDDKLDEDAFRKKLRKCLSNLHCRRDWLYMGVFERAPETGRLHFHAIMYVPEGQMIGRITEQRDYSTRHHRMQLTHPNSFFSDTFGRNDFAELSESELRHGNTLKYLLKYLEKTDERIIYSRGIPTEFYKEINDNDVICELLDFVVKYVLFDDVIDYDEDVLHIRSEENIFYYDLSPLPS